MNEFVQTFFNLDVLAQVWPLLAQGLWMTLLLALASVPLAMALRLSVLDATGARAPSRKMARGVGCGRCSSPMSTCCAPSLRWCC